MFSPGNSETNDGQMNPNHDDGVPIFYNDNNGLVGSWTFYDGGDPSGGSTIEGDCPEPPPGPQTVQIVYNPSDTLFQGMLLLLMSFAFIAFYFKKQ